MSSLYLRLMTGSLLLVAIALIGGCWRHEGGGSGGNGGGGGGGGGVESKDVKDKPASKSLFDPVHAVLIGPENGRFKLTKTIVFFDPAGRAWTRAGRHDQRWRVDSADLHVADGDSVGPALRRRCGRS